MDIIIILMSSSFLLVSNTVFFYTVHCAITTFLIHSVVEKLFTEARLQTDPTFPSRSIMAFSAAQFDSDSLQGRSIPWLLTSDGIEAQSPP